MPLDVPYVTTYNRHTDTGATDTKTITTQVYRTMIAAHDSGLVTFDIALLKKAFVGQVSRKEWKTICATMKAAGY